MPDVSWIGPLQPLLLGVVFAGMGLLLGGFLVPGRKSALVRAAGWVLFAVYWPFQAPEYFWPTQTSEPDPINGWFTLLGPLFLLWVAWHEYRSYKWDEDPRALRWFAGAAAISAITYFIVYEWPAATKAIIYWTAVQSAWLYNVAFFGGADRSFVVQDAFGESHICLPAGSTPSMFTGYCPGGAEYAVTVVLACTAIQSIMIFVGAIYCVDAPRRSKALAYLATVPTIYILNLFRNAGIVYGTKDLQWNPLGFGPHHDPSSWMYATDGAFLWMHSYVGKIGSLVALVVIALAVFSLLPQLHSNILDLFDLRKRTKPGFFGKPPQPAPPAAPESTTEA